jgi:hypothetical protein
LLFVPELIGVIRQQGAGKPHGLLAGGGDIAQLASVLIGNRVAVMNMEVESRHEVRSS